MKSYMELMQNINLELTEGKNEKMVMQHIAHDYENIYLVLTNKNISLAQ